MIWYSMGLEVLGRKGETEEEICPCCSSILLSVSGSELDSWIPIEGKEVTVLSIVGVEELFSRGREEVAWELLSSI